MKNTKKFMALVAVLAMILVSVFALIACTETETHECKHVCQVESCGKCLDKDCEDEACKDKCPGHNQPTPPPAHTCQSKCATCGKCTNKDCKEEACKEKCVCEALVIHICNDKCTVCGLCTTDCNDKVCKEKCQGNHEEEPAHECQHKCPEEDCGLCLDPECEDPACADHRCPGHSYTITFVVGEDGTLENDAQTEFVTALGGKLTLGDDEFLPEPTAKADHWHFVGWFDAEEGGNAIDMDKAEFEFSQNTTYYARFARDNGIWVGDTFKAALTKNTGAGTTGGLKAEYWLGGGSIVLEKGDIISVYMNDELLAVYVDGSSAGIEAVSTSVKQTSVTVKVAGEFKFYVKDYSSATNPNNWVCQYAGPTEVTTGSEIPAGCDAFTVTMGTNKITFFLVDVSGNPVSKSDFSKFCIYTFNNEIFGNWTGAATQGVLKEEMTGTGSSVPGGWIFRWGSGYGQQTANIEGALKAGKTYLIKLTGNQKDAEVTELEITSINTITLDRNYDGQPETKDTAKAYNGKLTNLPATPVREGFTFDGWFTEAEGGEQITLATEFTVDTTVYAHWTAVETEAPEIDPVE